MVALPRTYGGEDQLGAATALDWYADVGRITVQAAALPHPRQCQHCCHDNQLHPMLGAAQTPATRGDQISCHTVWSNKWMKSISMTTGLIRKCQIYFYSGNQSSLLQNLLIFIFIFVKMKTSRHWQLMITPAMERDGGVTRPPLFGWDNAELESFQQIS